MAVFTWQELIDRARTYVDDDHESEGAWLTPERWLQIGGVEYREQYRRWVRRAIIRPAVSTDYMDGASTDFDGVLAIVGVARDYGDHVELLRAAHEDTNQNFFWQGSTAPTGRSCSWTAAGFGDTITVTLDPAPNDLTASNYVVKWIPTVAAPTDATDSVEVPDGMDERLVLGMARRAHLKDSAASALLERLIMEAEAEMGFSAAAHSGGLRVVNTRKRTKSTPHGRVWPDPARWRYF
jgi:hypothetical protein